MKSLMTFISVLTVSELPAHAARGQLASHASFSHAFLIGLAMVLLVQAGHLVYQRISRATRLARLQRTRRKSSD